MSDLDCQKRNELHLVFMVSNVLYNKVWVKITFIAKVECCIAISPFRCGKSGGDGIIIGRTADII